MSSTVIPNLLTPSSVGQSNTLCLGLRKIVHRNRKEGNDQESIQLPNTNYLPLPPKLLKGRRTH